MTVNDISIEGFRNYDNATARFSGGVNVITGRNAQGKTNLLEAIFYLTSGRSFRSVGERDLISFNSDRTHIKANIVSGGREQTLEARFFRGRRRELYANGSKLKKTSELAGRMTAVLFGPDDLDMIKGGAAIRRKLMDQCLSQLRPGYVSALAEFNRLYDHKTRILRDYREKPSLLNLLDDFDLRLAQQSAKLIYYRSAFSGILSRKAAAIHREFSGGAELLAIRYATVGGMEAAGKKPEQILPELLEHQRAHRQAELKTGLCLSGAHKDDLEIDIGGKPARRFASQGQTRSASVSIKLAERDIHHDDRGEHPLLLLDDVLSELDEKRQGFILGKITDGQIFITCCDNSVKFDTPGATMLRVENGRILE
ncbi:MAG: DNA replication and repair protein RecF [Oscillospiraceae bacterium]|jgi:DNA replication and repair protein RecF|nr:DNA replication and repair protein RecF [Oscillospiraceae bacterium]